MQSPHDTINQQDGLIKNTNTQQIKAAASCPHIFIDLVGNLLANSYGPTDV